MGIPDFVPFSQVVDQIAQLCREGRSGTVFIVSDDNRAAQIHLNEGAIVLTVCRGRRGQEGLTLMRSITLARMRFDEGYVTATESEPGATQAIVDYLGSAEAHGAPGGIERRARPRDTALAGPAPRKVRNLVAPNTCALLERVLVKYIGPMAQIVCQDHSPHAEHAAALVEALAGEVPGADKAAQFRAEANAALQAGGGT